ncbi:hypothetical protein V5O48_014447 [Marasmius crinis-equi]|uniref:CxC2-like cysteine cluster KDZ transposase-associated domain-containing protein n=1 Tax=Marasmius crinis-equi TaxID=585013 RepID=A0ABR3EXB4_9AGAR
MKRRRTGASNSEGTKRQRQPNASKVYTQRLDDEDYSTVHSRVVNISSTNGRISETQRSPMKGRVAWTGMNTWAPPDDTSFALDPDDQLFEAELERPPLESSPSPSKTKKKKKKRSKRSRRPQIFWLENYQEIYLDELVRADGRGDFRYEQCVDCQARGVLTKEKSKARLLRCKNCHVGDLVCSECCVKRHRWNPLHRIERWESGTFKAASLKEEGLVIRLNHISSPCPSPKKSHQDFEILHTNGIHQVTLEFCECNRRIEPFIQLLRRNIYPSTQGVIQTCATFELLEHLHLLSLVGQVGTYDFYKFLEKTTNNTGVSTHSSRYRALQRMLIQWRHLKMLKRGGRGHVEDGVKTTGEGELAILCPSCPRPGINLPKGWEQAPPEQQFLYALLITVDFNFRLKNQLVSSWTRDPGLGDGRSYFVPRAPYEAYISEHVDESDVSTCVGFAALAQQNTRATQGLRYTGVGAVLCGRSEMVCANGVCNLEKGERYSNSNFVVAYAMLRMALEMVRFLIIAYDIACQWFANLFRRTTDDWKEWMRFPPSLQLVPVIPKFHHPAHREEGHDKFNCNLSKGLGHSDCECNERMWSVMNGAAPSTKPMGPGSRILVLNDHFGHYNWGKYTGLGATLSRKYAAAVKERNLQTEAHRGLTEALPKGLSDKWERTCKDWENAPWDKKGENPFTAKVNDLTQAKVLKELADYEADRIRRGGVSYHSTSSGVFLALGLELEEAQRRLQKAVKDMGQATDVKTKSIAEQRNVLRRKLKSWSMIRHIYMPGLLQHLTETSQVLQDGSSDDVEVEKIPLWMPSSIPARKRKAVCVQDLVSQEIRLRVAQCADSLHGIRHTLRLKSRMLMFKYANVSGQRDGTRSRTMINNIHDRARAFAESYRAGRAALLLLQGPESIDEQFKELKDSDVRALRDPERAKKGPGRKGTTENEVDDEDEDEPEAPAVDGSSINLVSEDRRNNRKLREKHGTGEAKLQISWIWGKTEIDTKDGTDSRDDELLREAWAKSRARAERAKEEVALLQEEMRRTLLFLSWKGKWWKKRRETRKATDPALQEGLAAYSRKQEDIQIGLEACFREMWSKPLQDMDKVRTEEEERAEEEPAMYGARKDGEDADEEDEDGDEYEDKDGGDGDDEDDEDKGEEE